MRGACRRGRTPPLLSWKVWNIRYRYSTKAVVRIVGCGLAAWRGHSRDHRTRTSNELCATVWELDDDLTPSSLSLFACQRPADTRYCSHLSTFCAQLRPPSIIEARFPSSGHRYGITRPQRARRVPPLFFATKMRLEACQRGPISCPIYVLRLRLLERVAKPGPAGQKAEYAHGRGPRYRFRLKSDQDGA